MCDALTCIDMHTLPINTEDLLTALRERNPQVESWLDRETGDIYQVSALFGDDEVEEDPRFADAMQQTPERFLRLPVLPAAVGFAAMRDFVISVSDVAVRHALEQALVRQRAFFHFQDVLATAPAEYARWQLWNRQCILTWADGWLKQQGVSRRDDGGQ